MAVLGDWVCKLTNNLITVGLLVLFRDPRLRTYPLSISLKALPARFHVQRPSLKIHGGAEHMPLDILNINFEILPEISNSAPMLGASRPIRKAFMNVHQTGMMGAKGPKSTQSIRNESEMLYNFY